MFLQSLLCYRIQPVTSAFSRTLRGNYVTWAVPPESYLHSKRLMTSPYATPFNARGKLRQQRYMVPLAVIRRLDQDVITLDDYTCIVRLNSVVGVRKFFQNARSHFKIRGTLWGTWNKSHIENPQILGFTIQNFGATDDQETSILHLLSIASQTENLVVRVTLNSLVVYTIKSHFHLHRRVP